MKKQKEKTIAEKLHEGSMAHGIVENTIMEAFEKYEPDIYHLKGFDFDFFDDWYDNSLEINFNIVLPYPYEPCLEVRQAVYDLGFSIVYWNFVNENDSDYHSEEIRGTEPRRLKDFKQYEDPSGIICFGHIMVPGVGYVDDRFVKENWVGSKYDCRGKIK